jgi:hypothetical protein
MTTMLTPPCARPTCGHASMDHFNFAGSCLSDAGCTCTAYLPPADVDANGLRIPTGPESPDDLPMFRSVVHECCVAVAQVNALVDTIEKEIAPIVGDKPTVVDRIRAALVVDGEPPHHLTEETPS